MRNPEQVLSAAAIVIGLVVGVGVIGSGASVPGCAAEQCTAPRNVQKPSAVLECPSGTLCYQGACVPSCASGAERVEKCDTDDDCTNATRPNCVERRCSACNAGERCIPALDICSPIRAYDSDAGSPFGDAGSTPAVTPLDGGRIDGSQLSYDAGNGPPPTPNELTHTLEIDVAQRIDLRMANTTTSAIKINALDLRGTGRVASSTVGLPEFDFTHDCEVRTLDTYTIHPPVPADLGVIQLQRDQGPLMRAQGLVANYVATFTNGRYVIMPAVATNILIYSTQMEVTGTEVSGVGITGVTAGRWPPQMDAPEVLTPDIFNLLASSRAALANIDARSRATAVQLSWERGIPLPGGRVLVEVRNDNCQLRCSFTEDQNTQLRITPYTLDQFRNPPCNASGTHRIFVDRSVGSRLNANADMAAGIAISAAIEIRAGFIGQINF